jgi:hypothetical protein
MSVAAGALSFKSVVLDEKGFDISLPLSVKSVLAVSQTVIHIIPVIPVIP